MIIKIIKKNKVILKLFKSIEYNKMISVETSEDIDAYFEIYKVITQLIIKIKPR